MPRFLVSGSNIIDHIVPFGRPEDSADRIGGGVNYALAAMSIFERDCMSVTYAGSDFEQYYGDWFRANGFSMEGVVIPFDRTYHADLLYQADGTYAVDGDRGTNLFGRNTPNMDILGPWLERGGVEGVHLLCHGNAVFFEQLSAWRKKGVKVGYEMELTGRAYVDVKGLIKEITDNFLDYFSLSLSETKRIWSDVRDAEDALELYRGFGCPVFLRLGTDGAYMIEDGEAYFSPLVDVFGTKDPTGCGNSSTAAAFVAMCRGDGPLAAAYTGAVAASVTAAQVGFIPLVDDALRGRCRDLVAQLTAAAEEERRI